MCVSDKLTIYNSFLFVNVKLGMYVFRCVSNDKRGRSGLPQVQAAYINPGSLERVTETYFVEQNTERPWNEKSTPLLCFKMGKLLAFEKYPFPI